tara:strand:- start:114 stop:359 length:246 start_codon:yes stop_codon:yes gene_type:complete
LQIEYPVFYALFSENLQPIRDYCDGDTILKYDNKTLMEIAKSFYERQRVYLLSNENENQGKSFLSPIEYFLRPKDIKNRML